MTLRITPQLYQSIRSYEQSGDFSSSSTSSQDLVWADTFDGNPLPFYKRIISARGNATTPASGTKQSVDSASGHMFMTLTPAPGVRPPNVYRVSGAEPWGFSSASFLSPDETDASAFAAFVKEAHGKIAGTNGMQILGELRETLHQLRNPLEGGRNLLNSYTSTLTKARHKLPRRARAQFLADQYLEFTFGWQPLISDVKDILNTVKDLTTYKGIAIEATRTKSETSQVLTSYQQTINNIPVITDITDTTSVSVKYYGNIKSGILGVPDLPRSFGFGLNEFLPTAWELIPFSFVVDYFTNVGNIIGASAYFEAEVSWAGKTKYFSSTRQALSKFDTTRAQQLYSTFSGGNGGQTWKTTMSKFNRDSVHETTPPLTFYMPRFATQEVNLAALLVSLSKLKPFY